MSWSGRVRRRLPSREGRAAGARRDPTSRRPYMHACTGGGQRARTTRQPAGKNGARGPGPARDTGDFAGVDSIAELIGDRTSGG